MNLQDIEKIENYTIRCIAYAIFNAIECRKKFPDVQTFGSIVITGSKIADNNIKNLHRELTYIVIDDEIVRMISDYWKTHSKDDMSWVKLINN